MLQQNLDSLRPISPPDAIKRRFHSILRSLRRKKEAAAGVLLVSIGISHIWDDEIRNHLANPRDSFDELDDFMF